MSDSLITAVVSVVLGIISLAALSVLLSPKAQTGQVIQASSQGLATDIGAAVAPVTGGSGIGGGFSLPNLGSGGQGIG